jgi:hypothetical protein
MTSVNCDRCGAMARMITGSICNFERQCLTDCFRCDQCGATAWRDRPLWNFPGQETGKEPSLNSTQQR